MKKSLLILVVFLATIPVFAQNDLNDLKNQNEWNNNRQMAVTLDPNAALFGTIAGGFGTSAGFEFALFRQFSLKTKFSVLVFDPSEAVFYADPERSDPQAVSYQFALEGRYYPMEHYVDGLFISGGVQYQGISGRFSLKNYSYDYDNDVETTTYTKFEGDNMLGVFSGLGCKFILGKNRSAFVIEPAFDYVWSAHFGPSKDKLGFPEIWMLGMHGIRITANFGIAF